MSRSPADDAERAPGGGEQVYRHRIATRVWHWLNAGTLAVMLMSGLMIFNAHPRLYWGQAGANFDPAWLDLARPGGAPAFPGWITIPSYYSLADARLWHLAFAWVLALATALYWAWALLSGHALRTLSPRLAELAPAHLWRDIADHARLRFPAGAAAARYGVLQKLAYGGVLAILLPLVILTGMTMSPGLDAALPWLVAIFHGRQSARSLHFIAAALLCGFFAVHIAMVVLSGPANQLRAMLTGWYRLPREAEEE